MILTASVAAALAIQNLTAAPLRAVVADVYLALKGRLPKDGATITYDERGVPIVDYGYVGTTYIGLQRNPVSVCLRFLEYYDAYFHMYGNLSPSAGGERDTYLRIALNNADWLIDNAVWRDGYAVFEYEFPWQDYNMTPPWRSAMAQGLALQVLIRSYDLTKERKYLDVARGVIKSFYVEVQDGGVTYKTPDAGWWFEEYAHPEGVQSKVLNGMMYSLLGILEYYRHTQESDARFLFEQGVLALRGELDAYDADGWSYYDFSKRRASRHYHETHIAQLRALYAATGDRVFKEFHDEWVSAVADDIPLDSGVDGQLQGLHHGPTARALTKANLVIFAANVAAILCILEIVRLVWVLRVGQNGAPGQNEARTMGRDV